MANCSRLVGRRHLDGCHLDDGLSQKMLAFHYFEDTWRFLRLCVQTGFFVTIYLLSF